MNEQAETVNEIVMTEAQMLERIEWLENKLADTQLERDEARGQLREVRLSESTAKRQLSERSRVMQFVLWALEEEGEWMTHAQRNGVLKLCISAIKNAGIYKHTYDDLGEIPF